MMWGYYDGMTWFWMLPATLLISAGLIALLRVPGLGPKKIKFLFDELKVESLADLRKAGESGQIAALKGFGLKTEAKILDGIVSNRYLVLTSWDITVGHWFQRHFPPPYEKAMVVLGKRVSAVARRL